MSKTFTSTLILEYSWSDATDIIIVNTRLSVLNGVRVLSENPFQKKHNVGVKSICDAAIGHIQGNADIVFAITI